MFETQVQAHQSKNRLNEGDRHCIYFVWHVRVEK